MSDRDDRSVKVPRAPRAGAVTPVPKEELPPATSELVLDVEDIEIELEAEASAPPAAAPTATVRRSLFGDLALGDDEIDDLFGAIGAGKADDAPPSLDTVALVEPSLSSEVVRVVEPPLATAPEGEAVFAADEELEVVVDEPEEQALLELDEDSDEADLTIETDEDFVEVEAPAELDRGAALAAAVTSRRRDDEDLDAAFALDPVAEVRARVDLLIGEAAVAESFVRAAEWYAHAADLLDGALGESARAEQVAERARALAPEVPLGLRVQRRLMLGSARMADAARLSAEEIATSTSPEERDALRWLHAFTSQAEDIDAARGSWREIASRAPGVESAVAALLDGASRHDPAAVEAALDAWSTCASGSLGASIRVARARMAEGHDTDAALEAVRAATTSDPGDLGAWFTLARLAASRGTARWLIDALAGVGRLSDRSAVATSAVALGAALGSIVGEPVTADAAVEATVGGRLVAHARELTRLDASDAPAEGSEPPRAEGEDARSRVQGLLRSFQQRREGAVASAAGSLFDAHGPVVRAGLLARGGSVDPAETAALQGSLSETDRLLVALRACTEGEVSLGDFATGEGPWHQLAAAEAQRRAGDDGARDAFSALEAMAGDAGVKTFAARAVVGLATPDELPAALRGEGEEAVDPRRTAALLLLAAATSGAPDADPVDIAELRRLLPGDVAVAELAAQLGLRGRSPMADVAAALEEVKGDPSVVQVASIRSALRRSETDPEMAAQSLWERWSTVRADACLATLVLRTPGQEGSHASTVLRTFFESAVEARDTSAFTLALGELAAEMLDQADRRADALQVLARTRALAPSDPLLASFEQSLLLVSGRDVEVSERAFEQLKSVSEPAAQVEVFERLARIDLFERGDLASAALSFAAILELDPMHAEGLRALERHYAERERWDELFLVLRQLALGARMASDALPMAHAATRVAERAGDDARRAAQQLRWELFDRGVCDRRLLLALDVDVRNDRDWSRAERVSRALAAGASDPAERAAHWSRVALAAEALRELPRAADAFAAAIEASPDVATLLGAARVAAARGEAVAAIAYRERAAMEIQSLGLSTDALTAAARAWRDEASDAERAMAAVVEAMRRDPGHQGAFTLALELLDESPEPALELDVISAYLAARSADLAPADAIDIYLRGATAAERVEDLDRARTFLRAVTALNPDHVVALRALVRLSDRAEDWSGAADARIRLAKSSADGGERLELLLQLGDLFEGRLSDPKRAEAAWRRVAQAAPSDPRAWDRLSRFYERSGEAAREVEARKVLLARSRTPTERAIHGLRLATLGRGALADQAMADEALKACAEDVRAGVDRNVRDVSSLERLAAWQRLRGARDAERVVAAIAVTLGVASDELRSLAPDGVVAGAGVESLLPAALDLLAPPALPADLRELLVRTSTVLDPLVPFDPQSRHADRLGGRPHGLRAEIERWARMLDLGDVEIFLAEQLPAIALPVGRSPARVLVAFAAPPSIVTRFAVARALLLITQGLSLPLRMDVAEFTLVMTALLRQFEPMFSAGGVDPVRLDSLSRSITRAMPRELHAELTPSARAVLKRPFDPALIHGAALEFGDRIALLATGDLPAAIAALAPPGVLPGRVIDEVPAAGRLLRVALSERFLEARRLTGFQDT
jgi:tetratricopeptide (TPR) repeat protein